MSSSPSGISCPASSETCAASRRASTAPRLWIPTIAMSLPSVCSTTWWAIRTIVRAMSGPSKTTLLLMSLLPGLSGPRLKGLLLSRGAYRVPMMDWRPAFRQRDLDRVEIAGHDRVLEGRARLVAQLAARVARRDVRERKQLDFRLAGQARGGECRRVLRLVRALDLVLEERRLVH